MPAGIPVATLAIGKAGATNAALLAAAILATTDKRLATKLAKFRSTQTAKVLDDAPLKLPACKSAFWGRASWDGCWPWRAIRLLSTSCFSIRRPRQIGTPPFRAEG